MKATKDTNQAAILLLDRINEKIQIKESFAKRVETENEAASNDVEGSCKTEQFILESWWMEIELLKNAKETLEQWIIDQDFNI